MISRLDVLAERRRHLVARSEAQRQAVASHVAAMSGQIALVETVVSAVRRVREHRLLVGAIGVALLVFGPKTARRWITRGIWLAPIAFEAYRVVKLVTGDQQPPEPGTRSRPSLETP